MRTIRTIVIGGTGNFGARICRALAASPEMSVVATCRHPSQRHANALQKTVALAALDTSAPHLVSALRALESGLVIHCAGLFQGQDYRVAQDNV